MPNLDRSIPSHLVVLANPVYHPDEDARRALMARTAEALSAGGAPHLMDDADQLPELLERCRDGLVTLAPCSGAVQPWMEALAEAAWAVALVPTYDHGAVDDALATTLLAANAAPAVLEMWSVLRGHGRDPVWCGNAAGLRRFQRAAGAAWRLRHTHLLRIGETEPWVRSAERDLDTMSARLGVRFTTLPQQALIDRYEATSDADAAAIAAPWLELPRSEPDAEDVRKGARLAHALTAICHEHDCDGAALACFDLLGIVGATGCLAMAVLNASAGLVGGCEGDTDSAVTLALLKALTGKPGWMANPVVGGGDEVLLAHCTAPVNPGGQACACRLRSHHESGIGASPEVTLPAGTVTLCRIGHGGSAMHLTVGEAHPTSGHATCRTQLAVACDVEAFRDGMLGLHQCVAWGDHAESLRLCARLLGLRCNQSAPTAVAR